MRPTTRKSLGLFEIVMMIFNDLIPESLYCQSDGFWSDPALRAEVWHKTCLIQHSLLIKMVSKWRILTTSVTFNSRRSQVDLIGWVQSDGFWQHPSLSTSRLDRMGSKWRILTASVTQVKIPVDDFWQHQSLARLPQLKNSSQAELSHHKRTSLPKPVFVLDLR